MKFEFDTLHYVTMLTQDGLSHDNAEAIVSGLSRIDINNVYTQSEIDRMLSKTVQKVFDDNRREVLTRYKLEKARLEAENKRIQEQIDAENRRIQEQIDAENKRLQEQIDASNKLLQEQIDAENKRLQEQIDAENRRLQEHNEAENRRLQQKLDSDNRQFQQQMADEKERMSDFKAEERAARRWMVGTIITCTLALAGYLSALIRLTH